MFNRSSSRLRRAVVLVLPLAAAVILSSACGKPAASYPDRSGVIQAQAEWCKGLAKLQGKGDSWEHMATCKDAYPSASAEYLKGMSKCFVERFESKGGETPDSDQVASDCMTQVSVQLPGDGPGSKAAIDARCEHMLRCEQVPIAECKVSIEKLESAQRALYTTVYNAAALADIADCVASASCSDDPEKARTACYAHYSEKLLWFPN